MARSESAISIVQFDGTMVSHAALTASGGGFVFEDYRELVLESRVSAGPLRDFFASVEVARDRLYAVIPRHEVTVRLINLPTHDAGEIASMVELTAGEFAPFPRESLIVQHRILDKLSTGEARVLLVLVQESVVQRHVTLLGGAGLEPQQIFVSTACLNAVASEAEGRVGLIHLLPRSLEIAVFDGGALQFSRGVAHDGAWDLADSRGREALAYETRDALSAFRRESDDGLGVESLLVSAEGIGVSEIVAWLPDEIGKDCQTASWLAGRIENSASLGGACPAVALGAAMAATDQAPWSIPLLPPNMVQERAMRTLQRSALRWAALVGIVLAALGAWFAQALLQRTVLIRELQAEIDRLAPGAAGVAAKQHGLQIISRQLNQENGFLTLLSAVGTAAPDSEFNFTRIQYDRDEGLDLWGRAKSKDQVLTEFLGNLRGLGEGGLAMLARAHSQYETAIKERNASIYSYHVTVPALTEESAP